MKRWIAAATVLLSLASTARAGDWSVEKRVDEASSNGTGDLLLSGDDVVVTGFGRAWLLDGATGETLATCLDVFPSETQATRYVATVDLLLAIRGEDYMLFGLRTGSPMSSSAGASFAVHRGTLFSLSGDEPASLARLEPMGRDGWVKDVDPGFPVDALTASKSGLVLSGPTGFLEVDPAGKELRTWRVPEGERVARGRSRTQVVDDLVLFSVVSPSGEGTLRVFKGKRPRELSLRGQTAPGVVTLDAPDAAPFVIRRGSSREWVLVALGEERFVAVDLARASAGPEVVAQRSAIARSGRALREGKVVDLVSGEATAGPGDGARVAHAFWYRQQGSTLHYGDLEGGEAKTLPLPPAATVSVSEASPLQDVLIFSVADTATVGTVELRRARVDVLETLGEGHHLQVTAHVATGKAAFFLLTAREGERGAPTLRIVRRSR